MAKKPLSPGRTPAPPAPLAPRAPPAPPAPVAPAVRVARRPRRKAVTKRDLVLHAAEETGVMQLQVHDVLQSVLDGMADALLSGMRVEFRDFGVFDVIVQKSRIGRNPLRPGTVYRIPERRVVKFRTGRELAARLAGKQTS
jgi:DNA-binding protein HU-beta